MIDGKVLTAAYALDWVAGDPEWLPHPVRIMGRLIVTGERTLRKPGQSPAEEFLAGGVLSLSLVASAYFVTATTIAFARSRSRSHGSAVETLLAWTCLASRSLHNEAIAVIAQLERGNLDLARLRLARIVGRDTGHLDIEEMRRAIIETLAESASDGIIAPLFYLTLGGVPLAMAYKAINTLDSMIGHADQRYFYFGKFAARLDDIANFLPSRLTALTIAASAALFKHANASSALSAWLSDGMKHKSPNAGQPESAMAGALKVRLGGENFYAGMPIQTPLLGPGFAPPTAQAAKLALHIAAMVSALGVLAALLTAGRRR